MQRLSLLLVLVLASLTLSAQKVSVSPTITPAVFGPNDQITVTYDVTGTALANLTAAWIWVWIPNKSITAKYNINPATSAADPAKFTKSTVNNKVTWSLTFKPADFFSSSISSETQMGMLIKASDWDKGQSTDFVAGLGYQITVEQPVGSLVFGEAGSTISIVAKSPVTANFTLFLNEVQTDAQLNLLTYSASIILPSSPSSGTIRISAVPAGGGSGSSVTLNYLAGKNSPAAQRPLGVRPGINYSNDATRATLCLQAPGKSSVYAFGDFSDWAVTDSYLMYRDGEYFWIELSGLTPGQEYAFQYLVDGTLKLADPYADKILDPDDRFISPTVYPGLKPFPGKAADPKWYFNRLAVLQTGQSPYQWQTQGYVRPKKESLVIYELLIRDMFGPANRTYRSLADTISYLKKLGVNAVELMPVMEFNGNESWGYNPTFMLAPDKAYGPKNELKRLVDVCHQNGMAVILDIALNHQDMPNPLVMMDFDFAAGKPTANNKWFNTAARHPFSVFYDMNHESAYTKAYMDSITHYWISEYKVDGYRFDLSKGFTQTNNPDNVAAWGAYDASRVALLKRMADAIWTHTPDAYVILEHLSENVEERALADYRAQEGKGMMLWGKMTDPYNETTMGYGANSAIAGVYHAVRGFQAPNLVGYMESHDEERLMYKNLLFGNSSATHNVRDLQTALLRMKSVSNFFYLVPGPKMLWQFGELGFDLSINTCEDGSVNPPGAEGGSGDCRLANKPPVWEFREEYLRAGLFDHTADLIRLKTSYEVFQNGQATFASDGLTKVLVIRNKHYTDTPSDPSRMNVVIAGNFNLERSPVSVTFPHAGTWYEYYGGSSFQVQSSQTITLEPGTVRMFTDVEIAYPLITGVPDASEMYSVVSPNPASDNIRIDLEGPLMFHSLSGVRVEVPQNTSGTWDVRALAPGMYVVTGRQNGVLRRIRFIRR